MRYYNPLRELDALRREVDRIFSDYGRGGSPARGTHGTAQINVFENTEDLEVEIRVPGLDPKDLDISVVRDELTVSGERDVTDVNPGAWHRQERPAGKFARKLVLPAEVEADKAKTSYKDGIVTLTLPKAESARPRRIEVAPA